MRPHSPLDFSQERKLIDLRGFRGSKSIGVGLLVSKRVLFVFLGLGGGTEAGTDLLTWHVLKFITLPLLYVLI